MTPDPSQNQIYLEALFVWLKFIEESGTDNDVVVLMLYKNDEDKNEEVENMLRAMGAIVKHVEAISHPNFDASHFEPWFVDIAFAKLRAFELTEYERASLWILMFHSNKGRTWIPYSTLRLVLS